MSAYALIIVLYGGRILIGQKRSHFMAVNGKNPWVIPGGTVEPSEAPKVTAQRELREETNKNIELNRFIDLGTVTDIFTARTYFIFSVVLSKNEFCKKIPLHYEFKKFKWIFIEKLTWRKMLAIHKEWLPKMLNTREQLTLITTSKSETR